MTQQSTVQSFGINDMIEATIWRESIYRYKQHENFFFDRKRSFIWTPMHLGESYLDVSCPYAVDISLAWNERENLRRSIIDENIPLECLSEKQWFIFDGGRRKNALLLSLLKYWPALPELREAMLHDPDMYLKKECAEAIGFIGGPLAQKLNPDIKRAIAECDDPYFRHYGVETLDRLDDRTCSDFLRELWEETRSKVDVIGEKEMFKENSGLGLLLEKIVKLLLKIDPKTACELLVIARLDSNGHVWHFTRKPFSLHKQYKFVVKAMQNSFGAQMRYLPDNITSI